MQERYADAKTYINAALKNCDSTENNGAVLEHAGDIYAMNGITDEAVEYWKKAKTDDYSSPTLDWKIKNKQYISEDELQKRMNPVATEVKKQKITGKATGKKAKRGRKK